LPTSAKSASSDWIATSAAWSTVFEAIS
jgi:hypothetical protein